MTSLNKRIVQSPLGIWFATLIILASIAALVGVFNENIAIITMLFGYWIMTGYICYVAARSQDRTPWVWALFGMFLMTPLAVIILQIKRTRQSDFENTITEQKS